MTTLEEERREVWGSILDAMREPPRDADRTAACEGLLRHLTSAGRARELPSRD